MHQSKGTCYMLFQLACQYYSIALSQKIATSTFAPEFYLIYPIFALSRVAKVLDYNSNIKGAVSEFGKSPSLIYLLVKQLNYLFQ